ncbi:hypothetical protein HanIR_Chr10g0481261 [Helianthus annuus]|nr:hypothetical protein HanIR_Chr10g0481261 [Helianthus annuus]
MAAHTLSETEFYQWMNESLVKLESQLQTLFNEFRSIRTSLEHHQTQDPSPPSTFVTVSSLSPTSATTPLHISSPPKQSPPTKPAQKTTQFPVAALPKPTPSPAPEPNNTSSVVPNLLKQVMKLSFAKDMKIALDKTTKRHEWRPPWRLGATHFCVDGKAEWRPPRAFPLEIYLCATRRTEWRPPWFIVKTYPDFHLEDKVSSRGMDCYGPSHATYWRTNSNASFIFFN